MFHPSNAKKGRVNNKNDDYLAHRFLSLKIFIYISYYIHSVYTRKHKVDEYVGIISVNCSVLSEHLMASSHQMPISNTRSLSETGLVLGFFVETSLAHL